MLKWKSLRVSTANPTAAVDPAGERCRGWIIGKERFCTSFYLSDALFGCRMLG